MKDVQATLAIAKHKIRLTRQQPYDILHQAAKHGHLRYIAPVQAELSVELKARYDWLHGVDVVHSADVTDIAGQAAEKLLSLMAGSRTAGQPKKDFHIGFAGGGLLQHTARLLAEKLRRTLRPLPDRIFFHAMVARFDENPATDPNSFVGYFNSGPPLPVATRFIGLMAPGIVSIEAAAQLRRMEGIREAYERVSEIDVLVTSAGGHWATGCSRLNEMYEERGNAELLARLKSEGCMGDLMWRPLGPNGPIELDTGVRAMTLVELSDLPKLTAQGKWAVLVLGPCATCGKPKTEILRTVLELDSHLITDLVVDSVTARAVLSAAPGLPSGRRVPPLGSKPSR